MLAQKGDVREDTVPDPKIQHPRDAVIKITACAICGLDPHLLDGYQPTMGSGDILGHENMGKVIELGSEVTNLNIGDRVVVPFTISRGHCWFCQNGLFSCCDRTNPKPPRTLTSFSWIYPNHRFGGGRRMSKWFSHPLKTFAAWADL